MHFSQPASSDTRQGRATPTNPWFRHEGWRLGLILLVGLVHGLIYIITIPPWQHYDEPNHFEYSWLIAQRGVLPHSGDYDQSMRREVAVSMINHGFFKGMSFTPDINVQGQPIWIGSYSQLNDPPLYYLLVSIPLRLFRLDGVTQQLYAARLISLLLYLLSIVAAWGAVREVTSRESRLRWLVPMTLALLPGYVDFMTSVNNNVGAVAFFSLFLWFSLRLVRRGFRWQDFLWAVIMTGFCLLTMKIVWIALPLLMVTLLFSLSTGHWRGLTWGLSIFVVVISLGLIFSWGDAAWWARSGFQKATTRKVVSNTPLGRAAFRLDATPGSPPPYLVQLLPIASGQGLKGKTVTLGGWMWASRPIVARSPVLRVFTGGQEYFQTVSLDETPTFHFFTVAIEGDPTRTGVILLPVNQQVSEPVTVYYDGLTLVEGAYPLDIVPKYDDSRGNRINWGGEVIPNLLRNPSAESAWLRFRPWVDVYGSRVLPDLGANEPSLALYSALDWQGSGWYYRSATGILLRTFWAKFGWGHVALLGHKPYRFLGILTAIGIAGAMLAIWRQGKQLPWDGLMLLGLAALGIWGLTYVRGTNYIFISTSVYYPVARYIYPAIIPTILIWVTGWLEIFRIFKRLVDRWVHPPVFLGYLIFFLFFIGLDIWSFVSIQHFYAG